MNPGRTVFAQIMDHLPKHRLHALIEQYRGNYKVTRFSCVDQFYCMAFAQLTYRESLRDIEACLRAQPTKHYHLGIRHWVHSRKMDISYEAWGQISLGSS